MKHVKTFESFLNEDKNELTDLIDKLCDDYGGFDDWSIEISNNKIQVFHTQVDKKYFDEIKEEIVDKLLYELSFFRGNGKWVFVEQTPKYFMLVKR